MSTKINLTIGLLTLFVINFDIGSPTDVEVSSPIIDKSLGFDVPLPLLTCHAKQSGYSEVSWYKDGIQVKRGPSTLTGHMLSVSNLLKNSSLPFKNPLELQGYYWCETELYSDVVHKFLFRIEDVNTFVCSLVSMKDWLGNDTHLDIKEKIAQKKQIYEHELQDVMFGFLPKPNVLVTDLKSTRKGIEVHFLLYAQKRYFGRTTDEDKVMNDQYEFEDIEDYLFNQTLTDQALYENLLNWVEFRGIDLNELSVKSTVGCYLEKTLVSSASSKEITWPYTLLGDVVIPEESCSTNAGLPVTRTCQGSFSEGCTWGNISGNCTRKPGSLTIQLKHTFEDMNTGNTIEVAAKLAVLTSNYEYLSVTALHIAANILKSLSAKHELDRSVIGNLFSSINSMLKVSVKKLNIAKRSLHFTKRILDSIEHLVSYKNDENKELKLSESLMVVATKRTTEANKHISGAAIKIPSSNSSLEDSSVQFLQDNNSFPFSESTAGFILPADLIVKRESELLMPCQINMVFFRDQSLFEVPKAKENVQLSIPTPVMFIFLSGGPAWNLSHPVELYFKDQFQIKSTPTCIYFDPKLKNGYGGWSTNGCSYEGLKNGYHTCHCNHLSIFSISRTEIKPDDDERIIFKVHRSLYIGCGISIVALALVVIFYTITKLWRDTIDQDILFNISLSFLSSMIMLLVNDLKSSWKPACMLIVTIFYYFVIAMFAWFFIQSSVFHLRFSKKTDMSDVKHFLGKSAVLAYGIPFFVVSIIWITINHQLHDQGKHNCWPTLSTVSNIAFIPILIFLVLTMCFNANAMYSISCRFKKDMLMGNKPYEEAVLKYRVAISLFILFVLSWIFGYFALHKGVSEMQILYSIFIILTSYYILLFFLFHERSLENILRKRKTSFTLPEIEKGGQENRSYQSTDK